MSADLIFKIGANVDAFRDAMADVNKTTNKPWVRFDLHDKEGVKYAVFAAGDSKRIQILAERQEDQKPIKIAFKVVPYNDRENYQVEWVEGAEG